MEDREIVAAIVAGDLAALADAYDGYAESLYGYCRWMLNEPDDAADAIQDTFAIAAGRLGRLQDPRRLRAWLYAVARNECHRRRRVSAMGPAETADPSTSAGDSSDNIERAELRRMVRAALSGLSAGEREVLELSLRHDLQGADLAAVLGISREQAHSLAASGRDQLDKALGPALVALTGRRACALLDALLADWDGQLTAPTRKEIRRHFDECEACDTRRRGALRPAALFGMVPLAALPLWLRREVLGLCSDGSDETLAYRQEVMLRAEPFLPSGFPQAIREPRRRLVALTRVAAVAGIVIALASAGIISALALGPSHPPHPLTAARTSASPSASVAQSTDPGVVAVPSTPSAVSPTEVVEQQTSAAPSASATRSKAAPSRSASSPAPSSPRPSPSPSTPAPTLTPTATPTPAPSPTLTVSAAPTVSPSTTPS